MATPQQASRLTQLYRKHVGSGDVCAFRLRDVLRREVRIIEAGVITVTPCLLTELRAERNFVGEYINANQ